ncbi:MAG: type II secretion system protein [Candidatus Gastranaerophilaceae bacterium]
MHLKGLRGFTLAEVLITLGIIGVVAALTLPAVITNTQNKERQEALKKLTLFCSKHF